MNVIFFIFSMTFLAAATYGYYKFFVWLTPRAFVAFDKAYFWYRSRKNG